MRSRPFQLRLPRGILSLDPFPSRPHQEDLGCSSHPPSRKLPSSGHAPDAPTRRGARRAGSGNTACPPDPPEAASCLSV